MGEYDRIVNGKRQLQNDGNGIGDRGYLAQPEVCAHIEQRRNRKNDEKDHDLKIAARRKEQYGYDNNGRQCHNADHLLRDLPKEVRADVRGGICIKACCERTDLVHRRNDIFIIACAVKGDREQRCRIHKMRRRIIKRHAGHMLERLDLLRSGTRALIGRVCQHNIGACIRRKFVLHDRKPATGIRVGWKERGYIVIHTHAADGKRTVNACGQKRNHDDSAFVHDLLRYFFQNAVVQERSPRHGSVLLQII